MNQDPYGGPNVRRSVGEWVFRTCEQRAMLSAPFSLSFSITFMRSVQQCLNPFARSAPCNGSMYRDDSLCHGLLRRPALNRIGGGFQACNCTDRVFSPLCPLTVTCCVMALPTRARKCSAPTADRPSESNYQCTTFEFIFQKVIHWRYRFAARKVCSWKGMKIMIQNFHAVSVFSVFVQICK